MTEKELKETQDIEIQNIASFKRFSIPLVRRMYPSLDGPDDPEELDSVTVSTPINDVPVDVPSKAYRSVTDNWEISANDSDNAI